MYKIIEKSITNNRNYTLGKTELNLNINDIFIYTYRDKITGQQETNKYKVIAVDTNKLIYTVILWELITFYS